MKPTSSSNILIGAILAGLQVLTGGSALADVFSEKVTGLIVVIIGAIQVTWHTYNQAVQVVPTSAVAAVVDDSGALVAGPAAAQTTGTPVTTTETTTTQVSTAPPPSTGGAS